MRPFFVTDQKSGSFFYSSYKEKIIRFAIRKDKTIAHEEKNHINDELYVEEFIELNYKNVIKYWNGLLSDREFLNK